MVGVRIDVDKVDAVIGSSEQSSPSSTEDGNVDDDVPVELAATATEDWVEVEDPKTKEESVRGSGG